MTSVLAREVIHAKVFSETEVYVAWEDVVCSVTR